MSKIIKAQGFTWDGISRKDYKDDSSCFRGVHRYSLLGEQDDEHELNFQTRYFEVQPGGYTSLEYHRHPHSVIVIRGSGSMILGNEIHDLDIHDVVFISPETIHQFHADHGEVLGFICIVDRYRDKPTLPDEDYLRKNVDSSKVQKKLKR